MSEGSETLLGEFPVLTSLDMGNERLSVFVTDERLIFASMGKRGSGAMTAAPFFGMLSGAFEDVVRSAKESVDKGRITKLTPERILQASKDNFQVKYEEIVLVEMIGSPSFTLITIVTTRDKMEFRTGRKFDVVHELLAAKLGSKLVAKKLAD